MLNHVVIMGRLTADPELRYTTSNKPVASFNVAVDRPAKSGEEKQTDFIPCVAWNSTAEFVCKYFAKGSMAVVEGRIRMRDWTDKEDNKHRTAEINPIDNIYFGESKKKDEKQEETKITEQEVYPEDDGDLPF